MNRFRLLAAGAVVIAAATALAWALARPNLSASATLVRAVADGAAVTSLGLALVIRLEVPRHRDELARHAATPLAIAASLWLLAELVRMVLSAAQTVATPVTRLSTSTLLEFVASTTAGRSGLVSLVTAVLVCGLALFSRPTAAITVVIAGAAIAGIAARSVTGHLSESPIAAAAVVGHAIAAAVWCGTLAALALTVSTRGQWARVLPRFSQLALICVAVLLVGGVIAALGSINAVGDLVNTGYGRLLLAKVGVTVGLTLVAWRNRIGWLNAARTHRASAATSLSRSLAELALMAVALTLAAGLTLAA